MDIANRGLSCFRRNFKFRAIHKMVRDFYSIIYFISKVSHLVYRKACLFKVHFTVTTAISFLLIDILPLHSLMFLFL